MISNDIIAVLLGIVSSSLYNIGIIFKKKGVCTLPDIERQSIWQNIKNFAKCKVWLLGFFLTIIQWFPLMIALKLGKISHVAPTLAIGFIVLILFSWLYLKEKIKIIEIIGVSIIFVFVIVLNASTTTESLIYNLVDINNFFKKGQSIGFLITFFIIISILFAASIRRKYKRASALIAIGSGLSYAMATIFAKGAIGSMTFANAKDFLTNSIHAWQWWIYLMFMILFYLLAFSTQQIAFQKGKAIVVSPTLVVMNMFTQVMAGVFIFNEWENFQPWQTAVKSVSIVFILIGVILLSVTAEKEKKLEIEERVTIEKVELIEEKKDQQIGEKVLQKVKDTILPSNVESQNIDSSKNPVTSQK